MQKICTMIGMIWMAMLGVAMGFPSGGGDLPPDHPFARLRGSSGGGAPVSFAEKDGILVMEAESLNLPKPWRKMDDDKASGGQYMVWGGGNEYGKAGKGKGMILFKINKPGTYRMLCSMRQPDGVEGDKCNDLWVQFSDAAMKDGEEKSLEGFLKVYGRSKGAFRYQGSFDVHGHKPQRGPLFVEFDKPGTYSLKLAGRSEKYQLDRVLLFHSSVSQDKATRAE